MPTASRIDWEPSDLEWCNKLGERLSKGGYVQYRHRTREWIVCTPDQEQVHQTVRIDQENLADALPWVRLTCTCTLSRFNDGVCVHKAAVHHHATQDSEYSHYATGR